MRLMIGKNLNIRIWTNISFDNIVLFDLDTDDKPCLFDITHITNIIENYGIFDLKEILGSTVRFVLSVSLFFAIAGVYRKNDFEFLCTYS